MGFSWISDVSEAHATLIAALITFLSGIAAVIGAVIVGYRQVAITGRQTDILARQTLIAEATLKADLFSRRLATFDASLNLLLRIADGSHDLESYKQLQLDFRPRMEESRFLFRPEVHPEMQAIARSLGAYIFALERIKRNQRPGSTTDRQADYDLENAMAQARVHYARLPSTFQPDLNIGALLLPNGTASDANANPQAHHAGAIT